MTVTATSTKEAGSPLIKSDLRYSSVEAAVLLGVSPNLLRQWRHKGRGPVYYKLEGRVTYIGEDLIGYMDQAKRDPIS